MAHMSSFRSDSRGYEVDKSEVTMSSSRRTVAAYSSSSLSRQEVVSGLHTASVSSASQQHRGHYAVSSHVNNGNLVVDNGAGVIQHQQHGVYEENLSKFKGRRSEKRLLK